MKARHICAALLIGALSAPGLHAATTLSKGERERVSRAAPRDRAELRSCLIERKKGQKKGTVIGAAGAGGGTAVAGGNLGESLLGAGVGALAGDLIGKETATSRRCRTLLERNR